MKNLPKDKRDKIILVSLGTLIVLIALWYDLISAQKTTITNIAKATLEQQAKVGSAQRLVSNSAQLVQSLEVLEQRFKNIEGGMVAGDKYSWIIQTINNFLVTHDYTSKRRVEIPQFSRETACDVGPFTKFPYKAVSFSVRGTAYFNDFGKFVADFENSFPFLRIQNIELEPATAGASLATADAEKLAFRIDIVALVNPGDR